MDALNAQDELLEYYRREVAYLREQGADFARRYPRVAGRIALGAAESPDPHTERLVESFAFLTARIHRDLDREFPVVAESLLDNLCPALTRPVPSMTVAQFSLDPSQGKVMAGLGVPRGSMLRAVGADGEICRFQVAWDTTLWPLRVAEARLEESRILRLDIRCLEGVQVEELELETLRVHLCGDLLSTMPLHEMLVADLEAVEVETQAGDVIRLGSESLVELGFDEGQEVVPRPAHAHPAYGLLQEYFTFPRKFQFFDFRGLRGRLGRGDRFALRLVFSRGARALSTVGPETFRLGCVPVVNLFTMTSEPIIVDHRRTEYLLVADRQRERSTEIHSVLSVIASDPDAARPRTVPSVFTSDDASGEGHELYWVGRCQASLRRDITGTDTFLGFVDRGNVRQQPDYPVVFAEVACTNRHLAEQVPAGARLMAESLSRSMTIRVLYEPTGQRSPSLGNEALWKLVSLLRLNHRSLANGTSGAQTLRQMLMLFAGESARDQAQVRGLRRLTASGVTARVGEDGWRGFCRGTQVALEFDGADFAGSSPLLLGSVLARFFALYTTTNSFVQLRVDRAGEPWRQWPPLSGRQWVT